MNPAEPLLLLCLAVLVFQVWRGARRRSALNRALHEIRRPLQALALTAPRHAAAGGVQAEPVWQAITAVGQLDRELNGSEGDESRREPVAMRLMTEACVRRAESRAELSGSRIRLRWAGSDALVTGDGPALSGALENLLLNAIEHGGPDIVVYASVILGHLRLEVVDSGWRRGEADRRRQGEPDARRTKGDVRHGHGLAIAGRVAADHGGHLDRDFSENGSKVTLVLPVERPVATGTDRPRAGQPRVAC